MRPAFCLPIWTSKNTRGRPVVATHQQMGSLGGAEDRMRCTHAEARPWRMDLGRRGEGEEVKSGYEGWRAINEGQKGRDWGAPQRREGQREVERERGRKEREEERSGGAFRKLPCISARSFTASATPPPLVMARISMVCLTQHIFCLYDGYALCRISIYRVSFLIMNRPSSRLTPTTTPAV